jgi:hypothetical protein
LPNATITNNAGTLNINADAANSTVTVDGVTNFGSSQTLATLNIGAGGVATLTAQALGALPDMNEPQFMESSALAAGPVQAVPEPGALSLLAASVLSLLGRRRRAS